MKFSTLMSAVLAVCLAIPAVAADNGALALFRALREDDPAKRGAALLELAERDGYPSELALVYLTRAQLPKGSFARLLPVAHRRGGVVPAVLLLRAYRAEYDHTSKTPLDELELLRLLRRVWREVGKRGPTKFETPLFRELSDGVLQLSIDCGESGAVCPDVEALVVARGKNWRELIPPVTLLGFYYSHAFAAEGWELLSPQNVKAWQDSPHPGRRNFCRLLAELVRRPPDNEAEIEALVNFFFVLGDRPGALRAALEFTRRHPKSFALLLFTAVEAGDAGVLDKLKGFIKPEMLPRYLAMALKNSGKYAEALKLAPRIADPETRCRLELECSLALGDFKTAAKLAGDPASPLKLHTRIFALLEIAEVSGDVESYRAAERLAGKTLESNSEYANAVGYTALDLGQDRELAEKRIRFALACHPRNGSLLDSLAWARHLAGDRDGAWKYMDQALRRCAPLPESCEELEHAGAIRLAMGDREGARKYYVLALKLAQAGERRKFGHARYRMLVRRISGALEKIK